MLVEIQKVLEQIGVPTENGNLAWFQEDTIEARINDYQTASLVDPELEFADFVLKTDVTWNSTGGLAGCGIIFRSEPNFQMGEQYVFFMQRLSGLPLWDIERYKFGQLKSVLTGRVKANQAIREEQGSTNEIILVAQGNLITVYANQIRLSRVNDSRLSEGALAFVAFQNSGETTCQFDNTWVWEIQ
jgi:hypothetical protein